MFSAKRQAEVHRSQEPQLVLDVGEGLGEKHRGLGPTEAQVQSRARAGARHQRIRMLVTKAKNMKGRTQRNSRMRKQAKNRGKKVPSKKR